MPADDGLGFHQDQVGAPVAPDSPQTDPEDPVGGPEPGSLDSSPEDRKLLAKGEVLQGQRGPTPNQATQDEEDGAQNRHPRLPWVMDLVEKASREYAGQVTETQAWCGQ